MKKLIKNKSLLKDTRGLSTVEYVIVLALIAVAGIGLWGTFGEKLGGKIKASTTEVDSLKVEKQQ